MEPAYADDWTSVYVGDALEVLRGLPERSAHTCVTSPPYWSLRAYLPDDHPDKGKELGSEPDPETYVANLVAVFREVRRTLRDDGTLWINLGDAYAGGSAVGAPRVGIVPGLKAKDLIGLPYLLAFALRSDGWYWRAMNVWAKPNPMPESVSDRTTRSHEYVMMFSKRARYFYDAEAVKEPLTEAAIQRDKYKRGRSQNGGGSKESMSGYDYGRRGDLGDMKNGATGRNLRSVWNISTKPYPGSHYATFPPELVYPCVKAGSSERGCCSECLAPWERVVERDALDYGMGEADASSHKAVAANANNKKRLRSPTGHTLSKPEGRTVGWQPTCSCGTNETVPATVLDPFIGSGTTALAARRLGRRSIGVDLDHRNLGLIEERLGTQGVLL